MVNKIVFFLIILSGIFLVAYADIINPELLQALVNAALWLEANVPKIEKSMLESIVVSTRWWWQQVLDNADQIGTAWANEAMPAAEDAEVAAEEFATFIKETLGPILEAVA